MSPGQTLGRRAEELAARHLQAQGLTILARNWRRPEGEIDLIADDGGTHVFVEVRARTSEDHGHPLEAISAWKRSQVIRTARLYLTEEAPGAAAYRFDVVGVLFSEDGAAQCFHIPDAFQTTGP